MTWLVKYGKINRAARVARFLLHVKDSNLRFWRQHELIVVTLSLCLYWKTVRTNQVKSYFAHSLITTWPAWNNLKTLNLLWKPILKWRFRCSSFRSFLNSLMPSSRGSWQRGFGYLNLTSQESIPLPIADKSGTIYLHGNEKPSLRL